MDHGYAKFALFNRSGLKTSSYACRLRDNSAYEVVEERPLTEVDRAAGILSDQVMRFPNDKVDAEPDHKIRLVWCRWPSPLVDPATFPCRRPSHLSPRTDNSPAEALTPLVPLTV